MDKLEQLQASIRLVKDLFRDQQATEVDGPAVPLAVPCRELLRLPCFPLVVCRPASRLLPAPPQPACRLLPAPQFIIATIPTGAPSVPSTRIASPAAASPASTPVLAPPACPAPCPALPHACRSAGGERERAADPGAAQGGHPLQADSRQPSDRGGHGRQVSQAGGAELAVAGLRLHLTSASLAVLACCAFTTTAHTLAHTRTHAHTHTARAHAPARARAHTHTHTHTHTHIHTPHTTQVPGDEGAGPGEGAGADRR